MPISFDFSTKIEGYVEQVPIFLTPLRQPDLKQMQVFAMAFKVKGDIVDEGALYSIRSGDSILHQFHASDSMRWLSDMHRSEHDTDVRTITEPKELQSIADEFLAANGLSDKRASFSDIIFGQTEISCPGSEKPKTARTCAYVNYTYFLEGLPLFGPGAKIQVIIGLDGQVIGCYRFWREVENGGFTRKILGIQNIQEIFRSYPGFAQLEPGSTIVVERARLGYLTLPPSDVQGALIPVIELRGQVSTPYVERTRFIHSLVAIDYTEEELKRYRVFNKHIRGSCRVIY
jgi:hypothetical protein